MESVLFYVTCKDKNEAEKIGRTLVEERLAACANILCETTSFFWWEGKIDEAKEVALILKTKKVLAEDVINRVKQLHSYECPCVIALPIIVGNKDFLNWIHEETK